MTLSAYSIKKPKFLTVKMALNFSSHELFSSAAETASSAACTACLQSLSESSGVLS